MPSLFALLAIATIAPIGDLPLVDQLDDCLQARFFNPPPGILGMSRIMWPSSLGGHFLPNMTTQRDFQPENPAEQKVLAALEDRHIQMGLYLFGMAIAHDAPDAFNYRALKGPGIVTRGTPRPAWYPAVATVPDALPDWKTSIP
jgi:hypothetical protein